MIPQETIDQVREATDIVDLIGQYLTLKKRGRNFIALCPFHTEKTPSFNINPDRQIYHCFGCGKGGNAITFLMEHEAMGFVDAVTFLARRANITIREDARDSGRRQRLDKLNFAHEVAAAYYEDLLRNSRYDRVRGAYLRDKRGINDETVATFRLGLAGEDWDGLIRHAAQKDLTVDDLSDAGLVLKSDKTGKPFDRFRKRLMIPIQNLSGKIIAFGGRTLAKGDPVKYMNSPETALYNKSAVLYGLFTAREAIRESESAIVVEGYFDVLSLWQVGIRNVVASSGTAFTPQQARLLARFAKLVYLFFDADSAGQAAALRSIDVLFDAGLDVRIVRATAGEDPDSLARSGGAAAIEAVLGESVDYLAYRLSLSSAESLIEKERLIKEIADLANRISDPTRRALLIQEAANRLAITPDILTQQRSMRSSGTPSTAAGEGPVLGRNESEFEIAFVSLMFNHPAELPTILERVAPEDFATPHLGRLWAAMEVHYQQHGSLQVDRLLDTFADPEMRALVTQLAAQDWDPAVVESESMSLWAAFQERVRRRVREPLRRELAEAEARGDHQRAEELLARLKSYGLIDA